MLSGMLFNIKEFFLNDFKQVPLEYKAEYIDELVFLNWKRANIIQSIVLTSDLGLLAVDGLYYKTLWTSIPAYKNIFYAHILSLVVILIYGALCFILSRSSGKSNHIKVLYLSITIFSLLWGEALAINAQLIHGQISAYIVSAFCIASVMLINPVESTVIFLASYLSFIIGLMHTQQNSINLSGNVINASFLIILSILISKLLYSSHVKDFLNRKLVEENACRVNELNNSLERMVEERTYELIQANELIVSELKAKLEMELEVASARAIYEQKERELVEYKELERLRTSFFSNISHELKTPLNLILSAQQLLEYKLRNLMSIDGFNQVNKQTFIIRQNSYRLIRLVSNLLDITRIDSGFFELNLRNYDIVKVVEDIVMSVAEYAQSKRIELVFDTEIEEKVIACDADKVERVILNLLSNAVKFTEPKGSIHVNVFLEEDKVGISVKDTGIGVPESMQDSIFERFVQADNSLTRRSEGSGIGLSLVKSIVELHQGKIVLKSEVGKGSEFIVELPDKLLVNEEENHREDEINDSRVQMISVEFSDIYT